jgi:hypothetical protein
VNGRWDSCGQLKLSGLKFNDLNENHANNSEPGLENWQIHITGPGGFDVTVGTANDGTYSQILPTLGVYTVCEVLQVGWTQTFPEAGSGTTGCDAGEGAVGYSVDTADYVGQCCEGANITGMDFGNHLDTVITPSPTPSDTPSPTPSDTPSPTPSDTPSPTPSDTPSPTPSDTPSPTPSPTPSDTPSPTPSDTPSPTPSDTPSPTPSATPSATPSPTPTLPDTGGTPTPTPTLPDTNAPPSGSNTPVDPTGNAFLLLLVASVAALLFTFLPRKKDQRPKV